MVIKAICVLAGDVVKGVVNLTQHTPDCPVEIKGEITGLKEGLHGFHIHEFGDNSNGCTSAGGHFNPSGADHGSPDDCESHRHAGDLGNVNADCSGVAKIDLQDVGITLYGKNSIVGRSAVVHAEEDDLGKDTPRHYRPQTAAEIFFLDTLTEQKGSTGMKIEELEALLKRRSQSPEQGKNEKEGNTTDNNEGSEKSNSEKTGKNEQEVVAGRRSSRSFFKLENISKKTREKEGEEEEPAPSPQPERAPSPQPGRAPSPQPERAPSPYPAIFKTRFPEVRTSDLRNPKSCNRRKSTSTGF